MVCACGQTLRVSDEQQGRLFCPACEGAVTAQSPPVVARPAKRWRRWGVGGLVGLVMVAGLWAGQAMRWYAGGSTGAPASMPGAPFAGMRSLGSRLGLLAAGPHEEALRIPDRDTGRLLGEQVIDELAPAGRIASFLALTGDAGRGLLLTSSFDGLLRCYSLSLQLLGERRLPAVAYQLVLDEAHGLLYAAVARAGTLVLGPLGDREQAAGDLHVYDVGKLLQGQPEPGGELVPVRTMALRAHVHALHLSRDGNHLYYLIDIGREAQAGRIDTATWTPAGVQPLRGGGHCALAVAPDTGLVAGLSGGRLFVIDPDTWTVKEGVAVLGTMVGFAMGASGQLYLIERRAETYLLVVDVKSRQVRERLLLPLRGRIYTQVGAGGRSLYLSTSAVLDGRLLAFRLDGQEAARIRPVGQAGRDRARVLRGGLFVSPDGKLLLTANGHVFRAPSGA